jgi:hypothetical protein
MRGRRAGARRLGAPGVAVALGVLELALAGRMQYGYRFGAVPE